MRELTINQITNKLRCIFSRLTKLENQTQVNTDWNATSGPAELLNKPDLSLKADLVGGTVPSSQLPSYVDDILEFADLASLPVTGETGKIYVTLDDNKLYRWSGSIYVEVSAGSGGSIKKEATFQLQFDNAGVGSVSFTLNNTTNSTSFTLNKLATGRYQFIPNVSDGGYGYYEIDFGVHWTVTAANTKIDAQLLSAGPGGCYILFRDSASGALVDPGVLANSTIMVFFRYTDYSV